MKPDILDEHFYMSAEKSFSDVAHYDKYDRTGPKIFVGEWATREGEPTPNLESALGDAAWLIGLERNSDLVIMECYAPLFVNVNAGAMQWPSDLIGYDALTSYGSPSYWTQVMFAAHTGTEVVSATLAECGPPDCGLGDARRTAAQALYQGCKWKFGHTEASDRTGRSPQREAPGHPGDHERQVSECNEYDHCGPRTSSPQNA